MQVDSNQIISADTVIRTGVRERERELILTSRERETRRDGTFID
jgi:hypothetical protein